MYNADTKTCDDCVLPQVYFAETEACGLCNPPQVYNPQTYTCESCLNGAGISVVQRVLQISRMAFLFVSSPQKHSNLKCDDGDYQLRSQKPFQ